MNLSPKETCSRKGQSAPSSPLMVSSLGDTKHSSDDVVNVSGDHQQIDIKNFDEAYFNEIVMTNDDLSSPSTIIRKSNSDIETWRKLLNNTQQTASTPRNRKSITQDKDENLVQERIDGDMNEEEEERDGKDTSPNEDDNDEIFESDETNQENLEVQFVNKKGQPVEIFNVEKRGWLVKLGFRWKNWKLRYFVLKRGYLKYYKSEMDEKKNQKPLGSICVKEVFVRHAPEIIERNINISNVSQVVKGKNIYIKSQSASSRDNNRNSLSTSAPTSSLVVDNTLAHEEQNSKVHQKVSSNDLKNSMFLPKNALMLLTLNRNYYFIASSTEEMNDWIVTFRMSKFMIHKQEELERKAQQGVFSEQAAKDLLFENLKMKTKQTSSENDSFLESVFSKYEEEKEIGMKKAQNEKDIEWNEKMKKMEEKLLEQHLQRENKYIETIKEKDEEIKTREIKYLEQIEDLKKVHLKEMLLEKSSFDRELTKVESALDNSIEFYKHKNTILQKENQSLRNQIVDLLKDEQKSVPFPNMNKSTNSKHKKLTFKKSNLEILKLNQKINTLEYEKRHMELEKEKEMFKFRKNTIYDYEMKLIDQQKMYEERIISLECKQRENLARNHSSLTIELGKLIYKKDCELIKLKYGYDLQDFDNSNFYSGRALKESIQHIESLVKQVESLKREINSLNNEKEQARVQYQSMVQIQAIPTRIKQEEESSKKKMHEQIKKVDSERDLLLRINNRIEDELAQQMKLIQEENRSLKEEIQSIKKSHTLESVNRHQILTSLLKEKDRKISELSNKLNNTKSTSDVPLQDDKPDGNQNKESFYEETEDDLTSSRKTTPEWFTDQKKRKSIFSSLSGSSRVQEEN